MTSGVPKIDRHGNVGEDRPSVIQAQLDREYNRKAYGLGGLLGATFLGVAYVASTVVGNAMDAYADYQSFQNEDAVMAVEVVADTPAVFIVEADDLMGVLDEVPMGEIPDFGRIAVIDSPVTLDEVEPISSDEFQTAATEVITADTEKNSARDRYNDRYNNDGRDRGYDGSDNNPSPGGGTLGDPGYDWATSSLN